MKKDIITAAGFLQYLVSNEIPGTQKVIGFTFEKSLMTLQFSKMPTITEWMGISKVWNTTFEQNQINLHVK